MKLTRYWQEGVIKPAVFIDETTMVDCSGFGQDWNEDFFAAAQMHKLEAWLKVNLDAPKVDLADVSLAPAIARPSKIVCIGLNYRNHAKELGLEPAGEPVLFFKATSAWSGPNDDLIIPADSEKTDWEVELAIVIGKKAKYVTEQDAMDHVAGFSIMNDYSERGWQFEREGQWVKGKSADTYAPFGPYMACKHEFDDPNNLNLWLKVNGETMQESSTSDFIFSVQKVVSYVSEFMTLLPGDVISTGTPAGVGNCCNPPRFVQEGDLIELGIEGLGMQAQRAVKELR